MADIVYRNKPILNDWTTSTLVLDLTNSLGEQFHFEIEPEADASSIPTRPTNSPGDKDQHTILNMLIPLLFDFSKIHSLSPTKKKSTPKKG